MIETVFEGSVLSSDRVGATGQLLRSSVEMPIWPDISGNSGAGRSVEVWVFDEGCVRAGSDFLLIGGCAWVEMQGTDGLLGAT